MGQPIRVRVPGRPPSAHHRTRGWGLLPGGDRFSARMGNDQPRVSADEAPPPTSRAAGDGVGDGSDKRPSRRIADLIALACPLVTVLLFVLVDAQITSNTYWLPGDQIYSLFNFSWVPAVVGIAIGLIAMGTARGARQWPAVVCFVLTPIVALLGWAWGFAFALARI